MNETPLDTPAGIRMKLWQSRINEATIPVHAAVRDATKEMDPGLIGRVAVNEIVGESGNHLNVDMLKWTWKN